MEVVSLDQSGTLLRADVQSTPGQAECCTPSKTPQENAGACCAQPANGSLCCDK